jgi:hypothetical protein
MFRLGLLLAALGPEEVLFDGKHADNGQHLGGALQRKGGGENW